MKLRKSFALLALSPLVVTLSLAACSNDDASEDASSSTGGKSSSGGDGNIGGNGGTGQEKPQYVLGSVVISESNDRTTYVQVIDELSGHYTMNNAIEAAGNGVLMARGRNFYLGLADSPKWIKYTVGEGGHIVETGSINFLQQGMTFIDYGYVIVDDETAVSISTESYKAIVWNPETMTIKGTIDLGHLERDGYSLEVWTTTAHDGLVYVPGRHANWDTTTVYPGVSLTVLDPHDLEVLGTAEDDRCASGGRPVWSNDGYGYVMGDGRSYIIQMAANAAGTTPPKNCLLRIKKGEYEFDPDFFHTIPSLTGGLESATELDTAVQGSGVAFAKMFYPDQLPSGVEAVDYDFWDTRVFKLWRIELGDEPTAVEVDGMPFSSMGFTGVSFDGKHYTGEAPTPATSDVYEIDPVTNTGVRKFSMDGNFYGLFRVGN